MKTQGVPMVRTGSIGKFYQPRLSTDDDECGCTYEYTGHLLDCRSYGGFSGSPVFGDFERMQPMARGRCKRRGSI